MAQAMALEHSPEEWEQIKAEWYAQAIETVERVASCGRPFEFDQVRRELPDAPHQNMYGTLMRKREVRQIVVPVAVGKSRTRSRRGGWSQSYVLRGAA